MGSQAQNRVYLSNEAEIRLSDVSEISVVMGGPLNTPLFSIPSPGGF